jgi:hypothetical protein
MEDLVTSGSVNRDAEDAFFIDEPSQAADPAPRRTLGLLPLAVSGFGLACTLGLVAVVAAGVMGRMDELHQLQRGFAGVAIASPPPIAAPPAAALAAAPAAEPSVEPSVEPTEPSDVVPAEALAPEPVAPPAAPAVRPAAPDPAPDPAPAEAPSPAPDLARVEMLSVEAEGASRLRVKCGGVSVTGTESVEIADFPAGFCTIEVHQFDDTFRMGLGVEESKSLRCGVEDGAFRCS